MVTTILQGGLSNCAFQIMACIAYSKKHRMPYCIPTRTSNERWRFYRFGNVHYEDVDVTNFYHYKSPDIFYDQRPYDVSYHEIPYHENIILEGHFQSWKYWIDYISEIRDLFAYPYEYIEGAVSIHKRLGDYLSMPDKLPPVSTNYIVGAINHFYREGYKRFFAFSDDQESFKDELKDQLIKGYLPNDIQIEFSGNRTDVDDLFVMLSCEHQIIANSSYSLLAYYLNRNPNKQCVAPRVWFGEGYGEINVDDLYPPGALVL